MKQLFGAITAISLLASPVLADLNLDQANACFDTALASDTNPSLCIDRAQNICMDNAQEAPATATLCFVGARTTWSQGLATLFAETIAGADEKLVAIAQIETKYDLLVNLLQCDRVEELSIAASDLTGEAIALQTTRCQSTASALTYMRLYIRAQSLDTAVSP